MKFLLLFIFQLLTSIIIMDYTLATTLNIKSKQPNFQLHILKKNSNQLELHGEFEQSQTILKNLDLSSLSCCIFTEKDIEDYNWPDQSIMLTKKSSVKLAKFMEGCYPSIEDMSLQRKDWFYLLMVEQALNERIFLVTFKGKILYGGVFKYQGTAQGALHPVIYPKVITLTNLEPLELQIMLVIRPEHMLWHMLDGYKKLDSSIKKRIEIKSIRDFFQRLGKLTNNNSPHRIESWLPQIKPVIKFQK